MSTAGTVSPSFVLGFAAIECPSCGVAREPGKCPDCGTEIDETSEQNVETRARCAAFSEASARVSVSLRSYVHVPRGHTPVTVRQFVRAVGHLGWFGHAEAVLESLTALQKLDLEDPKVIGAGARRTANRLASETEQLAMARDELALLAVDGELNDIRELAIEIGHHATKTAHQTMQLLTAQNITAARERGVQLKRLLNDFPATTEFSARLADLEANAGSATDVLPGWAIKGARSKSGAPQLAMDDFIASYSGRENAFEELALDVATLFGSILDVEFDENELLVSAAGSALTISALDNPLIAHRTMRGFFTTIASANRVDHAETKNVLSELLESVNAMFATRRRIESSLEATRRSELNADVAEGRIAEKLLDAYHDLVETTWRKLARLLLDLLSISKGKSSSKTNEVPRLGNLLEQLEAEGSLVAGEFAESCNKSMRNAFGHRTYIWDAARVCMVDTATNDSWDLSELDQRFSDLVGALAGADAGILSALQVNQSLLPAASKSLSNDASKSILGVLYGLKGFELDKLSHDGALVTVKTLNVAELDRLISCVAGQFELFPALDSIRIESRDEPDRAVMIDSELVRDFKLAPTHLKELAAMRVCISVRNGSRELPPLPTHLLAPLVAKVAVVLCAEDLSKGFTIADARRQREALSHAREMAFEFGDVGSPDFRRAITFLDRTRSKLSDACTGRRVSFGSVLNDCVHTVEWSNELGVEWPIS